MPSLNRDRGLFLRFLAAFGYTASTLPVALDLHSLYEQLFRTLLPHPARPGESLANQLERLEQLRIQQNEYHKLEVRLRQEKQFNRKVTLNAQLRKIRERIEGDS